MTGLCIIEAGNCVEHELDQLAYLKNFFNIEVWATGSFENRKGISRISSLKELPKVSLVVVQPKDGKKVQGVMNLRHYAYPEDVIFVLAASNYALDESDLEGVGVLERLFIPGNEELYTPQAAAVVLYDRMITGG